MRKFPYNHSDGPCGEITLPSVCRSMRKFLHAFISNSQKLVRTNPTRSESRRVTIKVAQIHQGSRRMTVKVAQIHQGSHRFIKGRADSSRVAQIDHQDRTLRYSLETEPTTFLDGQSCRTSHRQRLLQKETIDNRTRRFEQASTIQTEVSIHFTTCFWSIYMLVDTGRPYRPAVPHTKQKLLGDCILILTKALDLLQQ